MVSLAAGQINVLTKQCLDLAKTSGHLEGWLELGLFRAWVSINPEPVLFWCGDCTLNPVSWWVNLLKKTYICHLVKFRFMLENLYVVHIFGESYLMKTTEEIMPRHQYGSVSYLWTKLKKMLMTWFEVKTDIKHSGILYAVPQCEEEKNHKLNKNKYQPSLHKKKNKRGYLRSAQSMVSSISSRCHKWVMAEKLSLFFLSQPRRSQAQGAW